MLIDNLPYNGATYYLYKELTSNNYYIQVNRTTVARFSAESNEEAVNQFNTIVPFLN